MLFTCLGVRLSRRQQQKLRDCVPQAPWSWAVPPDAMPRVPAPFGAQPAPGQMKTLDVSCVQILKISEKHVGLFFYSCASYCGTTHSCVYLNKFILTKFQKIAFSKSKQGNWSLHAYLWAWINQVSLQGRTCSSTNQPISGPEYSEIKFINRYCHSAQNTTLYSL